MRYDPPRWPMHGPLLGTILLLVFLGIMLMGCATPEMSAEIVVEVEIAEEPIDSPIIGSSIIGQFVWMEGFCMDNEAGWIGVQQLQYSMSIAESDRLRSRNVMLGVFEDAAIPCVNKKYNRGFVSLLGLMVEVVEQHWPKGIGCMNWVRVAPVDFPPDATRAITWMSCDREKPDKKQPSRGA